LCIVLLENGSTFSQNITAKLGLQQHNHHVISVL
jgi:hypothetical protein